MVVTIYCGVKSKGNALNNNTCNSNYKNGIIMVEDNNDSNMHNNKSD